MVLEQTKGLAMEQTLNQASEREKNYDWLGAVKFFEKALSSVPEEIFEVGRGSGENRLRLFSGFNASRKPRRI